MFVDITEKKSPLSVGNLLRPYKRGEKKITKAVCFKVLRATNYRRNIRDLAECIDKLDKAERLGLKEAVLAMFCRREQPEEVVELGRKFAIEGGYLKAFTAVSKTEDGEYLGGGFGVDKRIASREEKLEGKDFSGYEGARFTGEAVNLSWAKNLPARLDFSQCKTVLLKGADLTGVKEIKFRDGAEVNFMRAIGIPRGIDFSLFENVFLSDCNLREFERFLFRDGAWAFFDTVSGIDEALNFGALRRREFRGGF